MESELLNVKLIDSFCKEYQSVWLIDTQKQLMNSFYINKNKNISNTVDLAVVMKTYEESRIWYIDNYVVPYQRSRVTLQTTWERVLDETAKGETYYVEYGKLENGVLSYNQLCYDRIENDEGRLEYIVLGFRNIDVRRKTEIDDAQG